MQIVSGLAIEEIMDCWILALEGDPFILDDVCAPDCNLWRSLDNRLMPYREAVEEYMARWPSLLPMRDISVVRTEKGFTSQSSVTFAPVGEVHISYAVTVRDGRIVMIEEYFAPEMIIPDEPPAQMHLPPVQPWA